MNHEVSRAGSRASCTRYSIRQSRAAADLAELADCCVISAWRWLRAPRLEHANLLVYWYFELHQPDHGRVMPPLWVQNDGSVRTRTTKIDTSPDNSRQRITSSFRRGASSSGQRSVPARGTNRRTDRSVTYSSSTSGGRRNNCSWRSKVLGVVIWLMILRPDCHLSLVSPHRRTMHTDISTSTRSSSGSAVRCIVGAAAAASEEPGVADDRWAAFRDEEEEGRDDEDMPPASTIAGGGRLVPAAGSQFYAPGGLTTATRTFTYRALSEAWPRGFDYVEAEFIRESCPYAQEPDTPRADDFWERALSDVMILSLSLGDESISARNLFDALDGIGVILTCCPGLLLNPENEMANSVHNERDVGGSSSSNSRRNTPPPLPTCDLEDVTIDGPDGERGRDGNAGFELTIMFSSALRAARLPSVALEALHGTAELVISDREKTQWETEMALVLLQMGRVEEATARLKNALGWDNGNLRVLQPLGAALVAQGAVAEGAWGSRLRLVCHSSRGGWGGFKGSLGASAGRH